MVYIQGNNRMFRKLILLFISMVGIFSSSVWAVGLGEYELNSGLNQPLNAKITLLSAGELSEHEVHASLASLQEFEKVGVERLFFLNNIRFETVRDSDGNVEIHLTSREPIKEPFLNFLIELNWPNGRMIREYTFLLDPPVFEESKSSTIEKTKSSKSAERNAPQTRSTSSSSTRTQTKPSFTGTSYGPVSSSDTLWSIASKTRPNNQVSIHQTLVAIYRANPHAFLNGNINNLKRGEVLNIPDAGSIAQVPHRAALQDVVVQNKEWRSGGARRIVQNSTSGGATKQVSGEARLSLSTPSGSNSDSAANSSGMRAQLENAENKLVESQEKSATLQAENEELKARLSDVLSQLESLKASGAINIEDAELAALAKGKDSSGAEESSDSEIKAGEAEGGELSSSDESISSGDEMSSSIGSESNEQSADSSGINGTSGTEQATDSKAADAASENKAITKPAVSQPTNRPVFDAGKPPSNDIMGLSPMYWGAIGGVLILVAFAVFWRMRKRMEEEDFQDDLVASAGAGTMDTTETFELPDVGDDMLVELDMDDDSDSDTDSDEENFDPIGEADIYIAYGKYEQAESLLKEAIDDNPIRSDLKVKLMECYAETEDKEQFDSLAQEVSQAVDAEEWNDQISELREKAFAGASESDDEFDLPSTEDIFGEDDSFDSELDNVASDDSARADSLDESDDDEFDIDMDLGGDDDIDLSDDDIGLDELDSSEAVTETFDALDDEEFSLDDGELGSDSLDDDVLEAEGMDDESLDDLGDDFSLDIEEGEEDSISLDDDDMSLDLDDDDFSFDDDEDDFGSDDEAQGEDEIATKLDLARAYIDMGDSDGAKEILGEVVSEGSEEQRAEAKALLDKVD